MKTAVINFSHIEIPFLIHTDAMHPPHTAWEITPCTPAVQEPAIQIVFNHLVGTAVCGPKKPVRCNHEIMNIRRVLPNTPLVEIVTIFIEDLNPIIASVIYKYTSRLGMNGDTVYVMPITGPRLSATLTSLAPFQKIVPILVKLYNARAVVSIRHIKATVGRPIHKTWAIEMSFVVPQLPIGTYGLNKLTAVIRAITSSAFQTDGQ